MDLNTNAGLKNNLNRNSIQGIFKVNRDGFKIKKVWSEHEDNELLKELEKYDGDSIKWKEVARALGKTSKQCYSRYRQINPTLKKGFWTKEEEEILKDLVRVHGKKWAYISKIMKSRSGKQIRHHYLNVLDEANNKKKAFSKDEDDLLKALFLKYGPKWQFISTFFQGRTGDIIKSRYYNKIKNSISTDIYMGILKKKDNDKTDSRSSFKFEGQDLSQFIQRQEQIKNSNDPNNLHFKIIPSSENNNQSQFNYQTYNQDYIFNLLKENNIKDDNVYFTGVSTAPKTDNSSRSFDSFDNNIINSNTNNIFREIIMRSLKNIQNLNQENQKIKSNSFNFNFNNVSPRKSKN